MLPEASVNLVFNLGSSFSSLEGKVIQNGFHSKQNFCFLSGLHTQPIVSVSSSFSYEIAVEMHPIAVQALFGIPCNEFENTVIDGESILSDLDKVEDKLRGPDTFMEKAEWLENYLCAMIHETNELHIAMKMNSAIFKMHSNLLSGLNVDMQDHTGYSRMHNHRLSTQWLGMSPMKYLQLQQFIKSLDDLHFTQRLSADIASSNGFYDQAHFNRIFRKYTDMTPKQYRDKKPELVGQLYAADETLEISLDQRQL